jgi:hypothetical protein
MSYNTIGMLIAATGWLHPVVAVLLMMGSSLTVVLHAADMTWENELSASRLPMKLTSPETDSPTDSLTSSSPLPSPLIQLTPNREQV